MVLILSNNVNLVNFGNGFIEDAYELYTNPTAFNQRVAKEKPIRMRKKEIHDNPELMDEVLSVSKDQGIPLDSAIHKKALEMNK